MGKLFPQIQLQEPLEGRDVEAECYHRSAELFEKYADISEIYVNRSFRPCAEGGPWTPKPDWRMNG